MNVKHKALAYTTLLPAIAALVLGIGGASRSQAQCGGFSKYLGHPAAWEPMRGPAGQPRLLRTPLGEPEDENAPEPSINGMWHVKFIAMGNAGIPDKTEIDAGFSVWHADGSEILNSGGRAPSTSSFCLGVWQHAGPRKYTLNHIAIAWDPTPSNADPNGVIVGPATIRENITLGANGNAFSGTFTITQYDESMKVLAQVKGNITGTRVTVNTPPSSVF